MFFYSNDQAREMYRAAIKSAADMMEASLAGFRRLQDCQLSATQEMLAAHAQAVERLDAAASVHELTEIGAQFVWLPFDKLLSCWGRLSANIGMNQMEFMRQAQIQSLEMVNGVEQALAGVPLAMGTEHISSALKVAVDTTRSSYAAGVRAMEQAEREAVARMQPAKVGGKERSEEKTRMRKTHAAASS